MSLKNLYLCENGRLLKILLILAFIFIIFVLLIIAMTPPANGYETSIYNAYPSYLWVFLILANFLATLIIVQKIFYKEKSNLWMLSLFAILFGNVTFLLLYLFRGYVFYGGANADLFSHIGWIKEIAQSGHVFENNFYPIVHIFTIIISDTLGISIAQIIWFVQVIFSMLYIPFMLLLARTISSCKEQALLITAFSTPLIFSIFYLTIHPSFFSFIFLPLLLYLYHKRKKAQMEIKWSILIIILCLLIVFFHPITALITITIFFLFIVSNFLLRKSKAFLKHYVNASMQHNVLNFLLILAVSFLAWYTLHQQGLIAMKSIYHNLIYGSEWTIATHYLSTLSIANLSFFQIIRLIILRYGVIVVYSLIAFSCLMILIKKFVFSRRIRELELSYSMQLIGAFFVAMTLIINYFIVANLVRSLSYFIMILTIFNGLVIYRIFENRRKW